MGKYRSYRRYLHDAVPPDLGMGAAEQSEPRYVQLASRRALNDVCAAKSHPPFRCAPQVAEPGRFLLYSFVAGPLRPRCVFRTFRWVISEYTKTGLLHETCVQQPRFLMHVSILFRRRFAFGKRWCGWRSLHPPRKRVSGSDVKMGCRKKPGIFRGGVHRLKTLLHFASIVDSADFPSRVHIEAKLCHPFFKCIDVSD